MANLPEMEKVAVSLDVRVYHSGQDCANAPSAQAESTAGDPIQFFESPEKASPFLWISNAQSRLLDF